MNNSPFTSSLTSRTPLKKTGAPRAMATASLLVIFGVALLIGLAAVHVPPSAQATDVACQASSPASAQYTVTVCLIQPLEGARLTGAQTVSATVTVTGVNPRVKRAIFYLDNQYLLTDYAAPYTLVLPTDRFVDGGHQLQVEALMQDSFTSARATLDDLTFQNGVTQPPINTRTFTPAAGSTPAPGQPFVLAAVGDGADGKTNAGQVADLIASWNPNLFLYLGDVYEKGMMAEFYNWYGTGTTFFSRFRSITNPTIGNHEYENGIAPGYFDYWDNIPNYYSFNFAGWHFISLNSSSQFGQTEPGSGQYNWLAQELETSPALCTLVYFHHPIYSLGPEGDTVRLDAIWALLAQHGVDIVLTGHDHDYQRWMPLDGQGAPDPNGVTQFVVGTGGHSVYTFVRSDSRLAQGFDTLFGALRLELYADRADYQFINTQGASLDAGSIPCQNAPPTPTPTLTLTPTDTFTPTPTPTPSPTPLATQSFTFTPVADAYVNQSSPDAKYGTATTLRLDASPIMNGYLRFDVEGVSGPIARAILRLYANSGSTLGYNVHSVADNSWNELTLTYNTAPAFGGSVGSSGSFSTGAWTTVDVTALVSGNGLLSLALTTSSGTTISLASREAGANAPQLVVQTIVTPTPTATSTNPATSTPSATSTPTETDMPPDPPTSTPSATSMPTPRPTQVFTFTPVADAYVNQSSPDANYGTSTVLRLDASPILRSYLRFNLQGLSGSIIRATLRLYANSGSSTGYDVHGVTDNSWNELALTYNTAPTFAGSVGSSGSFSTGAWTTVDVTALVSGNGLLSLALTTSNSTAISLASRETGASAAPQLVIETN